MDTNGIMTAGRLRDILSRVSADKPIAFFDKSYGAFVLLSEGVENVVLTEVTIGQNFPRNFADSNLPRTFSGSRSPENESFLALRLYEEGGS